MKVISHWRPHRWGFRQPQFHYSMDLQLRVTLHVGRYRREELFCWRLGWKKPLTLKPVSNPQTRKVESSSTSSNHVEKRSELALIVCLLTTLFHFKELLEKLRHFQRLHFHHVRPALCGSRLMSASFSLWDSSQQTWVLTVGHRHSQPPFQNIFWYGYTMRT